MPAAAKVALKSYAPPGVDGSTVVQLVLHPSVPTCGLGCGVKRIVAPGSPMVQPQLEKKWCAASLRSISVLSPSGIDGIGVVTDGIAVASRESIVMCPCDPVTSKSVTTSSRIVTL